MAETAVYLNNNLDREPDPEDLTTLVPAKLYIEGNTAWFVASYSLRLSWK